MQIQKTAWATQDILRPMVAWASVCIWNSNSNLLRMNW